MLTCLLGVRSSCRLIASAHASSSAVNAAGAGLSDGLDSRANSRISLMLSLGSVTEVFPVDAAQRCSHVVPSRPSCTVPTPTRRSLLMSLEYEGSDDVPVARREVA